MKNQRSHPDHRLSEIIQGVIWDMDGVLIDSMAYHYSAWKKVFQDYKVNFTQQHFQRNFGRTNLETIQYMLGDRLTEKEAIDLSNRKQKIFDGEAVQQAQLVPGVQRWLEYFHQKKIPQAVTSSNTQPCIEAIMKWLKIDYYFVALVSAEGLSSKPDPGVFLESARRIGAEPELCLVFEDAVAGVEGAKRAGMKCIAITTTNEPTALAQADLIIASFENLTEAQLRLLTQA